MLYENLTTQDDHLMHLVGIEKSPGGKNFFLVKNSWGTIGPYKGLIHVSETYFAINTVSLVVPKDALDGKLKAKLGI
jgi:bleomycin hydrolase